MIESARIAEYLYGALSGDDTLAPLIHGVFEGVADAGTDTPYIVFFQQSSNDTTGQNGYRLLTQDLWMVEAISTADDYTTLKTIADQVDTLLGRVIHANGADSTQLSLVRERPSQRLEVTGGVKYLRLGGQYRVWIH